MEESVLLKRGRVYVGDGAVRAAESARDDRELTSPTSEGDIDLPTAASVSIRVVEDVPLAEVTVEVGGPSEDDDAVVMNELSSLRPVGVLSSTEERVKGVAKDGYETGSDVDPEEVRRYNKGFTRVEVSWRVLLLPSRSP